MSDETIEDLLKRAKPIDYAQNHLSFAKYIFNLVAHTKPAKTRGMSLAALFDLAVTALYLEKVTTKGWHFCDNSLQPNYFYPFVNCCPMCVLRGEYHHVKSPKPQSANIGIATSGILEAFLDQEARFTTGELYSVKDVPGNQVADAIVIGPDHLILLEIKSAPLISFPVIVKSQSQYREKSHESPKQHPRGRGKLQIDSSLQIPIGDVSELSQGGHYEHLKEWLRDPDNLESYIQSWTRTFSGYASPTRRSQTHWLTNACGRPPKGSPGWNPPEKSTSISDGKSSVGMDRTDDIKKGIAQCLKMSIHFREFEVSEEYDIDIGIASNIHAVKHYDSYIKEFENVAWTIRGGDRNKVSYGANNMLITDSSKMHYGIDAIITLTRSHFNSTRVEKIYGTI